MASKFIHILQHPTFPQRLIHNLPRTRLNLCQQHLVLFLPDLAAQVIYPSLHFVTVRALYLLEDIPGEQKTGKSHLITALSIINCADIMQSYAFATPVADFAADGQSLLVVAQGLLLLPQSIVDAAQVIEGDAFATPVADFTLDN